MSPARWTRVLSHLNKSVNNFNNTSPNFLLSSRRTYAIAAASSFTPPQPQPNAHDSTHKSNSEVNLNKMFFLKPYSLALAADSPYRIDTPQYEGVKRFVLKMMLFYSKQSQFIRWSNALYQRVTDQVDNPTIYDVFCLEKTFKTTYSLLIIHMWLCLRRLKEEGKEGVELGQYLYEAFNHDLELRVARAGVNLLLTKWMKELEKIFYGNIIAYDEAIGKQDELQKVIWRNVFKSDDDSSIPSGAVSSSKPSGDVLLPLQAMVRYVRREASCLSLTDKEAVMSGNFMFTPLNNSSASMEKK